VYSVRAIVFENAPILRVSHDLDDHGWQFLGSEAAMPTEAAVLALGEVVQLDPSVLEVADLPPGWYARRDSRSAPWHRFQSES
jgi:hypothetical protein